MEKRYLHPILANCPSQAKKLTLLHLVKKVTTVPEPTVCRAPSQLRLMGHGQDPAEGSLEAKVRKYLPKDYQIVMATLGAYATIFMFFKLKPSKKKEEVVICMWCCVAVVMSRYTHYLLPAQAHQLPRPSRHYLTRSSTSGPNFRATEVGKESRDSWQLSC
ncbi:hypothetical protein PsorP6_013949 [Peronosclerospora sorghi]|uniref:Uncharacterized protein n=1 Tax=Peronosclerospora sorghi TaxID=230839 RepID=A0ACC0VHD4_9STRA|nr:hypothetical protein PsorP6_013949 [Peronosclerospora sorghi]